MFWIPSRCLALATLLLSISCDSTTLGQEKIPSARVGSNPARIKLTTERAIVFKDGYCLIAKKAGQATHVLDRFHIMQKMNKAIDKVRAGEARQMKEDGYEPILKHSRWCLLKRRENLTDKQTVK